MRSIVLDLVPGDLVRIFAEQQLSEEERAATRVTTQLFVNDAPVGIPSRQWVRRGTGENHHIGFRNSAVFRATSAGPHRIEYRAQLSEPTRVDIDAPQLGSLIVRLYRSEPGLRLVDLLQTEAPSGVGSDLVLAQRSQPLASGRLHLAERGPGTLAFITTQSISRWNAKGASAEMIVDQLTGRQLAGSPFLYRMGENVTSSLRSLSISLNPVIPIPSSGIDLEWSCYIGNGSGVHRSQGNSMQALVFAVGAPEGMFLRALSDTLLPGSIDLTPEASSAIPGLASPRLSVPSPAVVSVQLTSQWELSLPAERSMLCRQRVLLQSQSDDGGWVRTAASPWCERSLSKKDDEANLENTYSFPIAVPGQYRIQAEMQLQGPGGRATLPGKEAELIVEAYW